SRCSSHENAGPGLELLRSLGLLLISLVLLILGLGVATLFLLPPTSQHAYPLPTWLNMETFSDLKVLLWETILTALVVFGLPTLSSDLAGKLDWTALVLPAAIGVRGLGLVLIN